MKQGKATREGAYGQKVEPKPRIVDPEATAFIGIARGTHVTDNKDVQLKDIPIHGGRGLKAPMVSHRTSNSGSQGKH